MQQRAKFIDVTRTFVPVDTESFPQTLHVGSGAESPEDRIPVVAYAGQNFLPTSYGYKSFFGTNQKLDIDAISARIDMILIYQTAAFINILIALTEEGLYYCDSMATGTWTHAVEYDPPADAETYYPWSYCVLNNELYFYQQGRPSLWRIFSSAEGIEIEEITPNFLNMEGQIGIFKAGSRLGFWDSDNSCAWSTIDDYSNFTPSVTTLAGNTKFTELVGTIITIQPHGDGFIIYSTKSIIYVRKAETELFQWSPKLVLAAGIAYPRQVAVGLPDTTHYAYTSQGIYLIQSTEAKIIVPEVWDHLRTLRDPKYLKFIQGRYLFIEVFESIENSKVAFKDGMVPEGILTLPGATGELAPAIEEVIISRDPLCGVMGNYDNLLYQNQPTVPGGEDTGGGEPMLPPADVHPTQPNYKPLYSCHLRMPRFTGGELTWTNSPCPIDDLHGGYLEVSPEDIFGTDNTRTVLGTDAYEDGQWTIERFVATQTALWQIEENALENLLTQIEQRTESDSLTSHSSSPLEPPPFDSSGCSGATIPSKFTKPYFGMNKCSFWLTRYGIEAMNIRHLMREDGTSDDTIESYETIALYTLAGHYGASCAAAATSYAAASGHTLTIDSFNPSDGSTYRAFTVGGVVHAGFYVARYDDAGPGGHTSQYCAALVAPPGGTKSLNVPLGGSSPRPVTIQDTAGRYKSVKSRKAFNKLKPVEYPPIPETAYCEFVGWTYTAADGSRKTLLGGGCAMKSSDIDGSGAIDDERQVPYENTGSLVENLMPFSDDGQVCEAPFEPIVIPGEPAVELDWPDQTVTYPSATFLLRDGTAAPLYPVVKGAYVYDTHLKKWGKLVLPYQHLLDYSPINTNSQSAITPETFGILAGVCSTSGYIYMFDAFPKDSWITYGKIGYYRNGFTSLEELRVDFNTLSSGYVKVEGSLNGKTYNIAIDKKEYFEDTRQAFVYGVRNARWHNITIGGHYDISYIEYKGFPQGNR